jgi:hypothetical protein
LTAPDDDDPYAQPPPWVPLSDLPRWLERRFKLPGSALELARSLIEGIREFKLPYRVQGFPYFAGDRLPPGFKASSGPSPLTIEDWDLAETDWKAGTVRGPARRCAQGDRYPIEVLWLRAVQWAEGPALVIRMGRVRAAQSERRTLAIEGKAGSLKPHPVSDSKVRTTIPEPTEVPRQQAPKLRKAPKPEIRKAMQAVYDDAESGGTKPPNIVQIVEPVLARLRAGGFTATQRPVQAVAREGCFEARRLGIGERTKKASP